MGIASFFHIINLIVQFLQTLKRHRLEKKIRKSLMRELSEKHAKKLAKATEARRTTALHVSNDGQLRKDDGYRRD